jgi:hypothetical protein
MGRTRKQGSQFRERASVYLSGDVLRVHVAFDPAKPPLSLWLAVERCDERHQIVFGRITGAPSGFGRALSYGAKLGVAYHLVQENTSIVAPTDSHSRGS